MTYNWFSLLFRYFYPPQIHMPPNTDNVDEIPDIIPSEGQVIDQEANMMR
jgi:hypothetical protein